MTDFYALLKQSIVDRGLSAAGERQEMYAQARRAVIKQLWDYRPPLAADEIDMRVGNYDTAVERIEADMRAIADAGHTVARPVQRQARAAQAVVPRGAPPVATAAATAARPAMVARTRSEPRGGAAAARRVELPPPLPQAYDEPDEDEDEEAYNDDYASEAEATRPQASQRVVRWADRGRFEMRNSAAATPRFEWPAWLGTPEQTTVRIAAIVAGALFIVLVAIISYELGARSSHSVTLPIGVRHEVSDAATASRIAAEATKVSQTYTIFDGADPTVFATTPDNPIAFDSTGGFARISSSTSAPGVKVTIGPGVAARLAGQNVRVVIVARSSPESGAAGMRFAYQSGLAISHWQTANLGADYAGAGIEWRVPTMRTDPNGDYLLIEPGIPGDGTGVDVKSIRIDVLGP